MLLRRMFDSGFNRTTGTKASMVGLSIVLFWGCASASSAGGDQSQVYSTLASGSATLTCGWTCSIAYGSARAKMKELYVGEDWRGLAATVMEIGHASDQSFFYLGRAAEGLEAYDAALKYYRRALIEDSGGGNPCNNVFNNCDGFVFPAEINARIEAVQIAIAKRNAPAPQTVEPKPPTVAVPAPAVTPVAAPAVPAKRANVAASEPRTPAVTAGRKGPRGYVVVHGIAMQFNNSEFVIANDGTISLSATLVRLYCSNGKDIPVKTSAIANNVVRTKAFGSMIIDFSKPSMTRLVEDEMQIMAKQIYVKKLAAFCKDAEPKGHGD